MSISERISTSEEKNGRMIFKVERSTESFAYIFVDEICVSAKMVSTFQTWFKGRWLAKEIVIYFF